MSIINKLTMLPILLTALIYISCSKEIVMEEEPQEMISSICMHDSITVDTLVWELKGSTIKLPSVFTIDDDEEIDYFYPRFDNDEIDITGYTIYTGENDWNDVDGVYNTLILVYTEEGVERAWDGLYFPEDDKFTITEYEGAFRFRFNIHLDGSTISVRGWACIDRQK